MKKSFKKILLATALCGSALGSQSFAGMPEAAPVQRAASGTVRKVGTKTIDIQPTVDSIVIPGNSTDPNAPFTVLEEYTFTYDESDKSSLDHVEATSISLGSILNDSGADINDPGRWEAGISRMTDDFTVEFYVQYTGYHEDAIPLKSMTVNIAFDKYQEVYALEDGWEKTVTVSQGDGTTLEKIKQQIAAQDLFGADVTIRWTPESDEYDNATAGTYVYTLRATDDYGQTASGTLTIKVVDDQAPVLSVDDDHLQIGYSQKLTLDFLKDYMTVTDNGQPAQKLLDRLTVRVGSNIQLTSDGYQPTLEDVERGYLECYAEVQDDSDNYSNNAYFRVLVADDVAPVLTLANGNPVSGNVKVGLSLFAGMTDFGNAKAQFLKGFKATDEIDGTDVSLSVAGFPSSQTDLSGIAGKTKTVTVTATDKSGNQDNQDVTIEFLADALPVFQFSDWIVSIMVNNSLTESQLKRIVRDNLKDDGYDYQDSDIAFNTQFKFGENAVNAPGIYDTGVTYGKDGAMDKSADLLLVVTDPNQEDQPDSPETDDNGDSKTESAWEKFWREFWECLTNFFSGHGWVTNDQYKADLAK